MNDKRKFLPKGNNRWFGNGRIFGVQNPFNSDLGKAKDPFINLLTLNRILKNHLHKCYIGKSTSEDDHILSCIYDNVLLRLRKENSHIPISETDLKYITRNGEMYFGANLINDIGVHNLKRFVVLKMISLERWVPHYVNELFKAIKPSLTVLEMEELSKDIHKIATQQGLWKSELPSQLLDILHTIENSKRVSARSLAYILSTIIPISKIIDKPHEGYSKEVTVDEISPYDYNVSMTRTGYEFIETSSEKYHEGYDFQDIRKAINFLKKHKKQSAEIVQRLKNINHNLYQIFCKSFPK